MFITDIRERYTLARWHYLMGEPFLSDIEYDTLDKEFKSKYPDDEMSKRPWSFDPCPIELLTKYNMNYLICSPTLGYMAESIPSINTQQDFDYTFRTLNLRSRLSFKIDGWNVRASYYNGTLVKVETRGRSGNNMTFNEIAALFPFNIPFKGRVAVTGELNIPNNMWKIYKQVTGNTDQRASVSTALARADIEYLTFLAFDIYSENEEFKEDKYKLLKSLGFKTPMFIWVTSYKELCAGIKYMSNMNKGYNHLTDGLVIENSDYQLAIRLGEWKEEIFSSYVESYAESPGMYGYSLEVLIRPVTIKGKTCSRVSVTNCAYIEDNNLQIGYPIAFNRRSEANTVLDATNTYKLQQDWYGKYDEYRKMIDERN